MGTKNGVMVAGRVDVYAPCRETKRSKIRNTGLSPRHYVLVLPAAATRPQRVAPGGYL